MNQKKVDCFIADLTHTKQGVQAKCFPLGAGLVAEYAKKHLGNTLNIELYKYPKNLEEAVLSAKPKIVSLSSYAWNHELAYTFALAYKKINPTTIIIMGGPNFPYSQDERQEFLQKYSSIDFFIFGEGEKAFVNLLNLIIEDNYDAKNLKKRCIEIDNCSYIFNNEVYSGEYLRIKNVDEIPSPYLNGSFDEFFEDNLVPLYETTRGCPFSCTFCSDGVKFKSKTYRYSRDTINENLEYIAKNKKESDSLIISDLNFGMYAEDIETCKKIAETKKEYNFPLFFSASAGKSKFKNILESVKILDGSWFVGVSVQSTDEKVLKNIKRKNLPYDKMIELADSTKDKGSVSYTEIILALPEDSLVTHFKSLKTSIDAGLNSIKMYQLMLLIGTEMSSKESVEQYGMSVKYRVMPGASGEYDFFNEKYKIAEFEQIVISNTTLSYEDYIECRHMNLLVEIFINNAMFSEHHSVLEHFNISKFDVLEYIKRNTDIYTPKIVEVFESFKKDTQKDLFDTYEDIVSFTQKDDVIKKHISGEMGNNELLDHKALSYIHYKDFVEVLYKAIVGMLKDNNVYTAEVDNMLLELNDFVVLKNSNFKDILTIHKKEFTYNFLDFKAMSLADIIASKSDAKLYKFYHTDEQCEIIKTWSKIYNVETVAGLGRFIQRTNLNRIYRKFTIELNNER